MSAQKTVELIALGDELLLGIRNNAHLTWLGDQLAGYGLPLTRGMEIRDDPSEIKSAFTSAWERSDIVITTGGLGPTSDDRTVEVLARTLGIPLQHDAQVEADIRDFFKRRGSEPTSNNFKQCQVIEGAQILRNPNGTAPGQILQYGHKLLIILPGPTRELHPMFSDQVIPALIDRGLALKQEADIRIRTMGIGESQLANLLDPVFKDYGDKLQVAYCAYNGIVDVRLASQNGKLDKSQLSDLGNSCRTILGDGFVGYGEVNPASLILRQLRSLNKTIAVAESCTGGLLGSRFTDVPGASKVFLGGLICYRNQVKESLLNIPHCLLQQHGAVSPECAVAMATGCAEVMESDYALSITGYAGPDGGSVPAGTIYLGYHSPVGVWSRKVVLPGNRDMVRERAVNFAIDFVRRKLLKYQVYDLLESLKC